jgi:hypothetical protein
VTLPPFYHLVSVFFLKIQSTKTQTQNTTQNSQPKTYNPQTTSHNQIVLERHGISVPEDTLYYRLLVGVSIAPQSSSTQQQQQQGSGGGGWRRRIEEQRQRLQPLLTANQTFRQALLRSSWRSWRAARKAEGAAAARSEHMPDGNKERERENEGLGARGDANKGRSAAASWHERLGLVGGKHDFEVDAGPSSLATSMSLPSASMSFSDAGFPSATSSVGPDGHHLLMNDLDLSRVSFSSRLPAAVADAAAGRRDAPKREPVAGFGGRPSDRDSPTASSLLTEALKSYQDSTSAYLGSRESRGRTGSTDAALKSTDTGTEGTGGTAKLLQPVTAPLSSSSSSFSPSAPSSLNLTASLKPTKKATSAGGYRLSKSHQSRDLFSESKLSPRRPAATSQSLSMSLAERSDDETRHELGKLQVDDSVGKLCVCVCVCVSGGGKGGDLFVLKPREYS